MTVLKEIIVVEIAEDLVCASYCPEENLIAFAGALSVGYLYSLAGNRPVNNANNRVEIALDDDDEAQRPEGLVRLNGHFK